MDKKKPFGLIIPKKSNKFQPKAIGIFGDDSDDESARRKKITKIPQSKPKVVKEELVDPSIYEYDSIYDDMKAQKAAEIAPKEKKSSRYIDSLLKAADKRKKEHERRVEKKVQVERESEGDKFKDKDMFVTSAYKKKMQEREEEEERERRENQLNDMMDVTKQKDLSGFYRHFLKQSVGEEKVPVFGDRLAVKEEAPSDSEQTISTAEKCDPESVPDDKDYSDSGSSDEDEGKDTKNSYEKSQRVREYRKRTSKVSSEDSDEELLQPAKESIRISQKRRSKELSDNKSHTEKSPKRFRNSDLEAPSQHSEYLQNSQKSAQENHEHSVEDEGIPKSSGISHSSASESEDDEVHLEKQIAKNGLKKQEKPRNIFEKRTIGEVFAAAQARYFQRLAARSS